MSDPTLQELATELHEHLRATESLPVERTASRWLGEAQAVAADAVDAPESVVETRVEQVDHLLSNVDSTGNEAADEHLQAARETVARIDERLQ